MKLKVLPPTLRKNNRYLTVDIKITSPISKDDLVAIIWDACVRFQGEANTANFNLWVMKFYNIDENGNQRDFVDDVRSALALANMFGGNRIAMTTIALSGTIKASQKYI